MADKKPTLEELRAMGLGRFIVDRSTHPSFHASMWPIGYGDDAQREKQRYRLPNINANSVLVTVISNHWQEGGWHRLQDMLAYTEEAGFVVALEEIDDLSMMPQDAIGIMRACASLLALDSGFEWCFMVDTDVLLEKDTLVRLLKHDRPVVYPLLVDLENKYPGMTLSAPALTQNTGLQPTVWSAMSCMLFNSKVFNCLPPYAWHGHDYHFSQHLAHFGHRIYVDTDTIVPISRGPARHLAKGWDELWGGLKRAFESRLNDDRLRGPPADFEPAFGKGTIDQHGVYWAIDRWKYLGVNGPMQGRNGEEPNAKDTG